MVYFIVKIHFTVHQERKLGQGNKAGTWRQDMETEAMTVRTLLAGLLFRLCCTYLSHNGSQPEGHIPFG